MGKKTTESSESSSSTKSLKSSSSSDPETQDIQKTVIIGVTGKMDSMIAAYLLKKQGYNCIGISVILSDYRPSLDMPKEESPFVGPCYNQDMDRIKEICDLMKIPFYGANAQDEHRDQVTDLAIESRLDGQEFNPYLYCNRIIIEVLLKKMEYFNADYIATGHYAKISHNHKLNHIHLLEINDIKHDQTYDLALLTKKHLQKLILPLSEISYFKVKKMAKSLGVDFIKKSKKNPLFFTYGHKFSQFIEGRVAKSLLIKGPLCNYESSMTLAMHEGIHLYYIGQKKLVTKKNSNIDPEYQVIDIHTAGGVVYVNMSLELKYTHCYLTNFHPNCTLDMSKPVRGICQNQNRWP